MLSCSSRVAYVAVVRTIVGDCGIARSLGEDHQISIFFFCRSLPAGLTLLVGNFLTHPMKYLKVTRVSQSLERF